MTIRDTRGIGVLVSNADPKHRACLERDQVHDSRVCVRIMTNSRWVGMTLLGTVVITACAGRACTAGRNTNEAERAIRYGKLETV
jgi:hypothetical protein